MCCTHTYGTAIDPCRHKLSSGTQSFVQRRIDGIIHPLEANISGEPHSVQGIMVLSGSMDHIGTVDYHVSSLIVGDQPAALEAISHVHEVGADPTSFAHVAIVGTDAFLGRKMSVLHTKLGLHLASQLI